jgi:hypothetical protein
MAWIWALRQVPWRTIIRHAPTIVETARAYYSSTRRTADETDPRTVRGVEALHRAVARLEEREVDQAALVADLAKQVANLTNAVGVLRARVLLALWGALLALVVGIVAVVAAFW